MPFETRFYSRQHSRPGRLVWSLRAGRVMLIALAFWFLPIALGTARSSPIEEPLYRFRFENARFVVSFQEVALTRDGKGTYRYQRKEMEEMVLPFTVSPQMMGQIEDLFERVNFLQSTDNYQHRRDFSHLGTMTLTMRRHGEERSVQFNFTEHPLINQLVKLFRGLATQEARYFELESVRANDPLSTPAQLRLLEGEFKSRTIADPRRFGPLLREIRLDEGVPLIARNHAVRLLEQIERATK